MERKSAMDAIAILDSWRRESSTSPAMPRRRVYCASMADLFEKSTDLAPDYEASPVAVKLAPWRARGSRKRVALHRLPRLLRKR